MALQDLLNEYHQATIPKTVTAAPKILQGNFSGGKDAQAQSQKGNFFQRNLNSLGAAGGGTSGALAGAAIGSVVPVVGTAAGAVIGGILGGAAGGAGGEAAKQSILNPGTAVNKGEVGKQALIGGASDLAAQGVGAGVGRLLGKGAEAATEAGTNTLASKIGQQVSTGGKFLNNSTERAVLDQAPELATFANNLGVKNAKNYESLGSAITGSNGALKGLTDQAVMSGGHVDLSGIQPIIKEALAQQPELVGASATKAHGVVNNIVQKALGSDLGGLGGMAHPENVFDAIKQLDTLSNGTKNDALKGVYSTVSKELQNRLYTGAGANEAAKALVVGPEDLSAIQKAVADQGFKGKTADNITKYIVDSTNNAQSIGDLRAAQAPAVKLSQLGQANRLGSVASEGVGGTINKVIPNSPFQVLKPLKTAATATEGVVGRSLLKAGGGLSGLAGLIGNPAAQTATRFATNEAGQALAAGKQPASAEATPSGVLNPAPEDATPGQPEQDSSRFDANTLQALAIHDIQTTGGKNLDKIAQLDNLFGPKAQAANGATPAQKTQQLNAKNAESVLGQIESSFEATGGGKGKIGGTLANLAGRTGLNSNVATYNDTATALAASLYKALGNTGTISDRDQQLIAKLIPKTTDTDTTAKAKVAQLRDLLQRAAQSAQAGVAQ